MSKEYLLQKNKRMSIVDLGKCVILRTTKSLCVCVCVCVCVHTYIPTETDVTSTKECNKRSTNSSFWGLLQAAVAAAAIVRT